MLNTNRVANEDKLLNRQLPQEDEYFDYDDIEMSIKKMHSMKLTNNKHHQLKHNPNTINTANPTPLSNLEEEKESMSLSRYEVSAQDIQWVKNYMKSSVSELKAKKNQKSAVIEFRNICESEESNPFAKNIIETNSINNSY